MRPTTIIVGATGASDWVPVDYLQRSYNVGYAVTFQESAAMTYTIQHGWYNPSDDIYVPINLTRSTTTATMTFADVTDAFYGGRAWRNHVTPKVGDFISVYGAGAPFDGNFSIGAVTNQLVITYTVANSGATSGIGAKVLYIRTVDDTVAVGLTGSSDGSITKPVAAIRLNVTAYTSGKASLTVTQGR